MAELTTVARPYAKAAFEHARGKGQLAAWSSMLALAAAVVDDAAFKQYIARPTLGAAEQADAVLKVVGDRLDDDARNFISNLAANKRLAALPAISSLFEALSVERVAMFTVLSIIVLIFVVLFLAGSPTTGKTLIGLDPLFGLDPAAGEDARITGPISAVWYFLFILPMFFFTPDSGKGIAIRPAVRLGLSELKSTIGEVRQRAPGVRCVIAATILSGWHNIFLPTATRRNSNKNNWPAIP